MFEVIGAQVGHPDAKLPFLRYASVGRQILNHLPLALIADEMITATYSWFINRHRNSDELTCGALSRCARIEIDGPRARCRSMTRAGCR